MSNNLFKTGDLRPDFGFGNLCKKCTDFAPFWPFLRVVLVNSARKPRSLRMFASAEAQQIDLLPALKKLESRFRREVNVTRFSPEEFRRKRALNDHFLSSVLKGKTILLKGVLDELTQLA